MADADMLSIDFVSATGLVVPVSPLLVVKVGISDDPTAHLNVVIVVSSGTIVSSKVLEVQSTVSAKLAIIDRVRIVLFITVLVGIVETGVSLDVGSKKREVVD